MIWPGTTFEPDAGLEDFTTLNEATGLSVWLVEQPVVQPGPVMVATLSMVVVALALTVTWNVRARPLAPAATEERVKVTVLDAKATEQLGTVPQLAEPAT